MFRKISIVSLFLLIAISGICGIKIVAAADIGAINPSPAEDSFNPVDLTLSWDNNIAQYKSGCESPLTYDLYVSEHSLYPTENPIVSVKGITNNSYNITGLNYFQPHGWRVDVHDACGNIWTGPVWSFATLTKPVPKAPSNLKAEVTSSGEVKLTWDADVDSGTEFRVECKKEGQTSFTWKYTTENKYRIDENLTDSGAYYYRVAAYNQSGTSDYSNIVNISLAKPDLVVQNIQYRNLPPRGTDPYAYFDITIKNTGGRTKLPGTLLFNDSNSFVIRIYKNNVSSINQLGGVYRGESIILNTNETLTFSNVTTKQDANFDSLDRIAIRIDDGNLINESNENNNTYITEEIALREPVLTADLSSVPASRNINKGEKGVIFTNIDFSADDVEDIKITTIKVTRTGGSNNDIYKIRLQDASTGQQIAVFSRYLTETVTVFDNLSWIIPKNSKKKLSIIADVSSNAVGAHAIHLDVLGTVVSGHVVAEGLVSKTKAKTYCWIKGNPMTVLEGGVDKTPPSLPSNIKVSNASNAYGFNLNISWTDPPEADLASIKIYRSTKLGVLGELIYTSKPASNTDSFNWQGDMKLTEGVTYYYTLRSVDTAGNETVNIEQYTGVPTAIGTGADTATLNLISTNDTPVSERVAQGSTNVTFLKFKLTSNTITHWTLKTLEVTRVGGQNYDIDKVIIRDSVGNILSSKVGLTFMAEGTRPAGTAVLDMDNLVLKRGQEHIFTVDADISEHAVNGHKISFKVHLVNASPSDAFSYSKSSIIGVAEGKKMTMVSLFPISVSTAPISTVSTPTPTPTTTPTPSQTLPEGTLIKLPNDPKVYIIENGKRKWIQTAEEFNQGGYKWSDVQETTADVVSAYAEYVEAVAKLIRAVNDSKVYKIIDNKKLWIPTAETFNKMGNKWEEVQQVSKTEENQYPRLKLVKLANDPKVYYLTEGGYKRHISTAEVFNSYSDNKWEDIVEIEPADLNAYPDVVLIRAMGGAKVYKLEKGVKRWIKTASAFNRLGLDWSTIAPVNATDLASYAEGEAIE